MKNKPIFYMSEETKEFFPYSDYLNIEQDGWQKWRNEDGEWVKKFFKALPKNLYPFKVIYEPKEHRKTLTNYAKTYSNLIFWIDNPALISRLIGIDCAPSNYFRTETIVDGKKIYLNCYRKQKISGILNFERHFGISNIESFQICFNRYIKSYCELNKVKIDDFPIDLNTFIEISNLSRKEYDIDSIVKDLINGQAKTFSEYKKSDFVFDNDLFASIKNKFPDKVAKYKEGQEGLINFFFGMYIKSLENKNVDMEELKKEIKQNLN